MAKKRKSSWVGKSKKLKYLPHVSIVLLLVVIVLVIVSFFLFADTEETDPRCLQLVKFRGLCEKACYGVQYNDITNKCTNIMNACCTSQSPFDDVKTCENVCMPEK